MTMAIGSTLRHQGRRNEPLWRRPRAWLRCVAIGAVLAAGLLVAPSAQATPLSSAVFTGGSGTVTVAGTVYAKQGGTLTLTVTTDNQARCVDVGAFAATQTSTGSKYFGAFSGDAPAGDGLMVYPITVGEGSKLLHPPTCYDAT